LLIQKLNFIRIEVVCIKKKLEAVIIILLIILIIVIDILIIQAKLEITKKIFYQEEALKEDVSFIDVTNNLRKEYLKEFLIKNFYNKYSEKELLDKLQQNEFNIWTLSIDSINLLADISRGTTEAVLNKYIGHFDETNIFNGNVGLAAHNRGYPVNYFKDLDKLKIGDVIDYRIDDFVKHYKVKSFNIIKDTDWTYLEDTNEDILTLITCVKNKPEYRLCVQAHKESEEILNNAEENFNSRYGNNFIIKCDFSRCS